MSTLPVLTHLTFTALWDIITISILQKGKLRQKEINRLGQVHIGSINTTGTWIQATWLQSPYSSILNSTVDICVCDSDPDQFLLFAVEEIECFRGQMSSLELWNELAIDHVCTHEYQQVPQQWPPVGILAHYYCNVNGKEVK